MVECLILYLRSGPVMMDAYSDTVKHSCTSGQLSSMTDAFSPSESYGFDASNNRTSVTDRNGHETRYSFAR